MESVRAMLVPAAVVLSVVGVVGCSSGSDASPTALRALSPPSSPQYISLGGAWSAPVNLGPVINSASFDEGPVISRDGLTLYFTSDRTGGLGSGDIWVSQREDEDAPWGAPVNLGPTVNSSVLESVPTLSRDEHRLYFSSPRAGSLGQADIWVSFRDDVDDDFGWQTPTNLGAPINTTFNDAGPGWMRVGGEDVLFFNSNRPTAFAMGNIWMSVRQKDGSFSTPVLVAELNSNSADARATVRRDGREVFFLSDRPGSLGFDLWTSTRKHWKDPWSTPVNLGPVVNSAAFESQPALSRDARTLFFVSGPGGFGETDLYMTTRKNDELNDDENDDENDD